MGLCEEASCAAEEIFQARRAANANAMTRNGLDVCLRISKGLARGRASRSRVGAGARSQLCDPCGL